MRLRLFGSAAVRPELEARLAAGGHQLTARPVADLTIDLAPTLAEKRSLLAAADGPILSLCYPASATALAAMSPRPAELAGFSVVPPVTDSSVVELAAPLQGGGAALSLARELFASLGLATAQVADGPGLIAARTIACLVNEALSAVAEGVARPATIDTAMRLGMSYPLGPLEWADRLGLPSVLAVLEGLQHETGDDRYRPHPLLRRLVLASLPASSARQPGAALEATA